MKNSSLFNQTPNRRKKKLKTPVTLNKPIIVKLQQIQPTLTQALRLRILQMVMAMRRNHGSQRLEHLFLAHELFHGELSHLASPSFLLPRRRQNNPGLDILQFLEGGVSIVFPVPNDIHAVFILPLSFYGGDFVSLWIDHGEEEALHVLVNLWRVAPALGSFPWVVIFIPRF